MNRAVTCIAIILRNKRRHLKSNRPRLQAIVAAKQMVKAGVGALVVLDPAKLGPEKHDLTLRRHIPTAAHAMVGIVSERGELAITAVATVASYWLALLNSTRLAFKDITVACLVTWR